MSSVCGSFLFVVFPNQPGAVRVRHMFESVSPSQPAVCFRVVLALQALSTVASPVEALWTAAGAFVGYVVADLVSGVFHWSVDNYGDGSTPVFGGVIEAFQGHHGEKRNDCLPSTLAWVRPFRVSLSLVLSRTAVCVLFCSGAAP